MSLHPCSAPYDLLLSKAKQADARVIESLNIGLTWVTCQTNLPNKQNPLANIGLAMALSGGSRTLPWPGTVAGKSVSEVARWIQSWNNIEAAVGLAAVNSSINTAKNKLLDDADKLASYPQPNLAVFEHFKENLSEAGSAC